MALNNILYIGTTNIGILNLLVVT